MEHFVIVLDAPEAIYFPGQVISGKVIIRSDNEETTKGTSTKLTFSIEL